MFLNKTAILVALIASVMAVNVNQSEAKKEPAKATDPAAPAAPAEDEFHSWLDFCVICDSFKWHPNKDKDEAANKAADTKATTPKAWSATNMIFIYVMITKGYN